MFIRYGYNREYLISQLDEEDKGTSKTESYNQLIEDMLTVNINPQYITDNTGKKISVILPIRDFKAIMEELEELEDIRLYDEAKKSGEPSIPMDEAFKMIETKRKVK